MTVYSNPILIKGRYQIVALGPDGEDDFDLVTGYAVLTTAGAKLRHEPSLDDARAWMETRIEEDNIQPLALRPPAKPRRVRR